MPGTTTELNLATAVDSDDNADYLTISLADSLRTVDGLFNNVNGHNHGSAHQGGPISSIPISAIPDGSITSAKITDATIQPVDMAAGAALGNLTQGQIMSCLGAISQGGDQLSNVGLALGDNVLPASGNKITASIPEATDIVLVNANITGTLINPSAAGAFGWVLFIDGAFYRAGPMTWCALGATQYLNWAALFAVAGPGMLSAGLSAGSHIFEYRLRASSAISSGMYLRPASAGGQERLQMEVFVIRR